MSIEKSLIEKVELAVFSLGRLVRSVDTLLCRLMASLYLKDSILQL